MKTRLFILAFAFALNAYLGAQTTPLVLVSKIGSMTYKGESKKNLDVGPGSLLSLKGNFRIKEKSSAVILCNEGFNILSAGKADLSKLCGDSVSKRSLGIDGSFSRHILKALKLTFLLKDQASGWGALKNGDGWGKQEQDGWGKQEQDGWGKQEQDGWGKQEQDGWGKQEQDGWGKQEQDGWGKQEQDGWGKQEQDGWGGKGTKIHLILPVGKLSKKSTRFSWSRPNGASSYTLRILDAEKMVLDSMVVTDTFAVIDLSKKNLMVGQRYSWNVSSNGDVPIVSNTLQFETMAADEKKAIQTKFAKSRIYYKLDPAAKLLMEAVALEQDQMFNAASETYTKAQNLDPKNILVKMMHAAFWMRGDLPVMAESAVSK
jgi:hypothetical protein